MKAQIFVTMKLPRWLCIKFNIVKIATIVDDANLIISSTPQNIAWRRRSLAPPPLVDAKYVLGWFFVVFKNHQIQWLQQLFLLIIALYVIPYCFFPFPENFRTLAVEWSSELSKGEICTPKRMACASILFFLTILYDNC